MKERLKFLAAYWLFWYLYFIGIKIIFLIYQFNLSKELPFTDWLLILIHGSWLDVSMSSWILLIPSLALAFTSYSSYKYFLRFINIYTILFISICTILVAVDYELYRNWGFRLDATPVNYILTSSKEIISQTNIWVVIRQSFLALFIISVTFYFYFKKVVSKMKAFKTANWKLSFSFILITASLIIPIRGGFGVAPMNVGFVFFHKNIFANQAAINVIWNFGYSLTKINKTSYSENLFDKQETEKLFSEIYKDESKTHKLIKNNRPNIIIIVLESFTSKMIEPLGGIKGITPSMNKLAKEGILFNNFYASGDRTDKGVVAILSGYPSQPISSIIKFPQKTQKLPFLSKDFSKNGYYTAWTYGCNINYANFNSYLNFGNFDQITEKNDFPIEQYINSKWGVDDHLVFEKMLEQINDYNKEKPFIWFTLTLSSHEPFEVPMDTFIEGEDEESLFLNSAHYTDKSLGAFIESAKKEDWWPNTLVIITADHGSRLLGYHNASHDYRKFKVPMLWLGGALTISDTVISTYGSHTDIAKTLLSQVNIENPNYIFSKNLLSQTPKSFAFYAFNHGFGFINDTLRLVFDGIKKEYSIKEGKYTDKDLSIGKAYLQKLYSDFNTK